MSKCKLGEVLKIQHGYAFKSENYVKISKYRLITLGNFAEGNSFKYNDDKATYYGGDFPKEFILHEGDLIMPLTEQVVGLFGNTAFVPKSTEYTFVLNQRVGKILINSDIVDKYYLHYLLATENVKRQIEARASGTRQRNISPEKIYDVEVDIPELNIQQRIGKYLYSLEKKLIINNKTNAELEAMAKTIYDYWFLQFEFPNENGKPYKSSGGKMIWNDELKREIPEGWEVSELGQLFTTERGLSYSTPNIETGKGVPMINLANFRPGGGAYKTEGLKHYLGEYPQNKVLKPYDLVMCNTQQTSVNFATDIIGRAMLVPDIFDSEIVSSHHVNVIRTKTEELKYYLLYLFNTDFFHKYISGYTNGTNILGLSFDGVEKYKSEIPNNIILIKFANLVKQIEMKKSEILKENQELSLLRDFLLPMLMNGQVGLKND
jgi:type I restriction enzyme S subunit